MIAAVDLVAAPPALRVLTLGDAQRSWREAGRGHALPLVLLHGIGSNAGAWAGQLAALSQGRRVIAWNAPGYEGSTPLDDDAPSPSAYAGALGELLDGLGVERCVLVGQSLGAIMATAFALDHPDRVERLILTSPAIGYDIPVNGLLPAGIAERISDMTTLGPAAMAEKRYARLLTPRAGPDAHDAVRTAMAEATLRGYTQASRLLAHSNLLAMVAALRPAVDVIWGAEDVITPPEACRRVAQAAGAPEHELPGLGHAAATEDPTAFNVALRRILNSPAPERAPWI